MTDLDLHHFEERLLDMQEEVMGVAGLIGVSAQPIELDQNRVGRLSRMDAMQGQAMAQASVKRQQQQLTLIAEALARIDAKEYGRCIECDEFIAAERLNIEPTASHCISCAQNLETR